MKIIADNLIESTKQFFFAPNVRDRILIAHPSLVYLICVAYVVISLRIGPAYMKNRKPYNIKAVVIAYDILQIVLNSFYFYKMAPIYFVPDWDFHCPADLEVFVKRHEKEQELILWFMFLTKLLDLMDTMFFILRKKSRHVSVLHVFHHVAVVVGSSIFASFDNTAIHFVTAMVLNTGVHAIMYTYYALASAGVSAVLRFKRFITMLQITQFVVDFVYLSYLFMNGCFRMTLAIGIMIIFFACIFFLFIHFYVANFYKKAQRKRK